MFVLDFLSQTMSIFEFVRLYGTLFDFFDLTRLFSTIPDLVRLYRELIELP